MMEFEFPKYNMDCEFDDDDTGFPFDDRLPPTDPSPSSQSQVPPPSGTSGSPFGSSRSSDDSRLRFDDHLRDIAARYPEFAQHIRPSGGGSARAAFPRERIRRDPWGRDDFDFARDFDLPDGFGVEGRFARPREFYPPNTQTYSTSPPFQSESRPPVYPQAQAAPKPPPVPPQTTQSKPTTSATSQPASQVGIQQSNTVDLGQVQPPSSQASAEGSAEGRGQRSMSAPPTDGATGTAGAGKRYVSSIQIPVLQQKVGQGQQGSGIVHGPQGPQSQQTAAADMGTSNSTPKLPPAPQPTQNKPHEYVIPIHIEGRDEPIIPKQNYQPPNNQQQYMQQQPPGAQNQPLFNTMKDQFKQQQEQVQKEQQQKFYEQQQQQKQQEEEYQQQAKPQIIKPTPLDMIQLIQKDVSELMGRVEKFSGKPKDKEYVYLDEMLTRNLLKLDDIETEGKDAIRQARREAIKCIEGCISILEAKANQNAANAAILAIEDKSDTVQEISTLGVQKSGSASNKDEINTDAKASGGDNAATTEISKT